MIKHIATLSLKEANELAAHQAAENAIQASVKAIDQIQATSKLLICLQDQTKLCSWDDVENCFPKDVSLLDDDFILWMETIKSEARQIYLLEKADDKSENEAARAAIHFINIKSTSK